MFDDDGFQLVFPRKVKLMYVGVVNSVSGGQKGTNQTVDASSKETDITDSINKHIVNERADKEFKVNLEIEDKTKKVLVEWQFEDYLDFRLSEIFIDKINK